MLVPLMRPEMADSASAAEVAPAAAAADEAVARRPEVSPEEPPVAAMMESERSRWCRPRSLNKLVIDEELMERSVTLTLNKYMLLSVTPERPATSMAIKLATVRMNGRATQNILPMLPILRVPFGFVCRKGIGDNNLVVRNDGMTSLLFGPGCWSNEILENESLRWSLGLGDVLGKHQRWNTKPVRGR